ncbi:MAG TPA: hypothetical protein VGL81_26730 [Polyangiaceae bacterium]|jgi:hypothetical protein
MSHKIEIAPTGRASCRGCKKNITKGIPRFCEEFANPYSDEGAMSFRYWHLECAATKLANELAPVLAAYDGPLEGRASVEALVAEHLRPPMPHAEHAPNGRARCRACDESIAKGELRVAFERTFDGPMGPQKGASYVHARCLTRYLEREKEQGREAPELGELVRQVEANSLAGPHPTLEANELAELRTTLGAGA